MNRIIFPNFKSLYLDNDLTSSFNQSENFYLNIEILNLSNNKINHVSISSMNHLKVLYLSGHTLTSSKDMFIFSNLSNLTDLYLYHNRIEILDEEFLSNFTKLAYLELSSNFIKQSSEEDLSNFVTFLKLNNNHLTEIPGVSKYLREIYLQINFQSKIELKFPPIRKVDLENNFLYSVPALANLSYLEDINLQYQYGILDFIKLNFNTQAFFQSK
jgi:Leucine-rich repeat (LRR) protein